MLKLRRAKAVWTLLTDVTNSKSFFLRIAKSAQAFYQAKL
jgi:hypothetical protein